MFLSFDSVVLLLLTALYFYEAVAFLRPPHIRSNVPRVHVVYVVDEHHPRSSLLSIFLLARWKKWQSQEKNRLVTSCKDPWR